MTNKLPIVSIFIEALSFPYIHRRMLLKNGLPLLIVGGVFIILNQYISNIEESLVKNAIGVIASVAFILALVMAVVGCHRIFLLDKDVVEKSRVLNWTGNEIKYIGWWVLIGLCTALISIPFMFIFMPFMMTSFENFFINQSVLFAVFGLINIPIYYIVSRWSLVLPSSAIDIHGKTLSWSWGLSSNNGWRLTLLIGFLPFFTDIIFNLLPTFDSIFFNLFHGVLWLIIGVIEIGLLSLSYKFLIQNESYGDEKE